MTREEYISILEIDKAELTKESQKLNKQLEVGKEQYNDLVKEKD